MHMTEKKFAVFIYIAVLSGFVLSSTNSHGQSESGMQHEKGAVVNDIRFWSNPRYTRIAIDLDKKAAFTHTLKQEDCLEIKIHGSRLSNGIEKTVAINDLIVAKALLEQVSLDEVTVVMNVKHFDSYKIFSLNDPFRIIIDIWRKSCADGLKDAPGNEIQIMKKRGKSINTICIDPGFGGRDTGACCNGISAKDVNLQIAWKVDARIKKELGINTVMTRDEDTYISLEERAVVANTMGADLLISIHTNGSRYAPASGIETFVLNLTADSGAVEMAMDENFTGKRNLAQLDAILSELMENAKITESERLASNIQNHLFHHLSQKYDHIVNRGVKQAPFYILLGSEMPSAMVQTGFLTNPTECKHLQSENYQDDISIGIVKGIKAYIREMKMAPNVIKPDQGTLADPSTR